MVHGPYSGVQMHCSATKVLNGSTSLAPMRGLLRTRACCSNQTLSSMAIEALPTRKDCYTCMCIYIWYGHYYYSLQYVYFNSYAVEAAGGPKIDSSSESSSFSKSDLNRLTSELSRSKYDSRGDGNWTSHRKWALDSTAESFLLNVLLSLLFERQPGSDTAGIEVHCFSLLVK
jgi:hypothetical protein